MRMRMHLGLGLALAMIACLPGCCCPMTCAPMGCCHTSGWVEALQDQYYCIEDQMLRQSCCMQQNWQKLMGGTTSQCNCHACAEQHGDNCSDCATHDCTEHPEPKSRVEITGPRPLRDPPPPGFKKGCKRCRQTPCRCGYCEGCDEGGSSAMNSHSVGPSCAAPQVGNFSATENLPAPPTDQPAPAPAYREPSPMPPPSSGPTPIRTKPPGSAAPKPAPPAGVQMQSAPVDVSAPTEQGPTLEQISYQETAPASPGSSRKRDGWQPVQGSKPVR